MSSSIATLMKMVKNKSFLIGLKSVCKTLKTTLRTRLELQTPRYHPKTGTNTGLLPKTGVPTTLERQTPRYHPNTSQPKTR
jgi:hypothetical protein